jgi:uroporphyrinogen-III synthase
VKLLVTRPEADAERTAAVLHERGHEIVVAPLLRIEAMPDADLGDGRWAALVLTSANAVPALERHARRAELTALPVFAVGRRTAAAAKAIGCADVIVAGGDLQDLAWQIREQGRGSADPLLYLAGEDRSGDLAAMLAGAGIGVRTVAVYRAVAATGFPPAIHSALAAGEIDGVLHFSRRSVEIYLDCARAAGLLDQAVQLTHYCLSRQVAEPLADAPRVRIAARAEEAALIELIPA